MPPPIHRKFVLVGDWHKAAILPVIPAVHALVERSSQEPPTEAHQQHLKEWHLQLYRPGGFRQAGVFPLNRKQYLQLVLQ